MQKNLRLTILVMTLFSFLLFLLIIGPEFGGTTAAADRTAAAEETGSGTAPAANDSLDSLKPGVVDSSDEPTGSAIENDNGLSDVTCEITPP
jgi:hypothetical protein